ncbi:unnamed protein product [Lactuca saligna]|uniref:Pentatricopeptide repeat-containing protein n=1 Tax=Lactuca saligna TaxID=75948 RepID=A0AA35Z9H4_LACSI|nr:unnamed protein product [Lactuca saligna]
MIASETKPDNFTLACILRACSEQLNLEALKLVHGQVIVSDLGLDSITASALVSAYSKFGLVDDAKMVFDRLKNHDLVLHNTMITGYGSCGYWEKALNLFIMMRRIGNQPDGYTMVGLLSGLTCSSLLEIGQGIHGYCLRSGFDSNIHISSVLVSMYSRCGCMNSTYKVFSGLLHPDLVTWSALISGFSQSGEYHNALTSFKKMNSYGKKPDSVLVSILLAVTSQLAILAPGVELHGYAIRHCLHLEVMVSSALIDMYSKCGFLDLALKVFDEMPKRNIVSYNSVIASLGFYGLASEAFEVFHEVLNELLGMAGELDEAYELVNSLGEHVDSGIWGALLSCCDAHNDSKMAEIVSKRLLEGEQERSNYKIMVSNMFAGNGRWDDVKKLRDELDDVGKRKVCGVSWIET